MTRAEQRLRILVAGHPGCDAWRLASGKSDECGNCGASRAAHEIFHAMSAGADALRLWREYLASHGDHGAYADAARALLVRAQRLGCVKWAEMGQKP